MHSVHTQYNNVVLIHGALIHEHMFNLICSCEAVLAIASYNYKVLSQQSGVFSSVHVPIYMTGVGMLQCR